MYRGLRCHINQKLIWKIVKDTKTKVTVGDCRTLTEKKHSDWHIWYKRNKKLHSVTLKNTAAIPGLHANLFIMTKELQKYFQLTSEGETLILKKNSTEIRFGKKMANKPTKYFYWPPSSTRTQPTPLFWPLRIGNQKWRQPSKMR